MNRPVLLSVLTGLLLTLAFPNTGWGFLAWFAFVPLLAVLHLSQNRSQALGYGLITGIVFFGFSMHWLTHVTTVGWMLLVPMEAVYMMTFAWLARLGMKSSRSAFVQAVWIASAWTVTELLRSEMPVFGFGWNLLAYTQSDYLPLIQCANVVGAYGLGFLIMLVNASLFLIGSRRKDRRTVAGLAALVLCVTAGLWGYGAWTLARPVASEEYLRVSVVQGNIPQSVKWELMARDKILEIHEKLTQFAALDQPDLILWPEAAFPGYFNRDFQTERVVRLVQEVGTPLLVGGLHWVSKEELYNSAYFLNKDGTVGQRYDKLRLVPFGEYIPLRLIFGWLTPIADDLGISDFSHGKDPVIFRWAREAWPFGVLICFEDVFTDLARQLADLDARFLVVITNDAWFGKTNAPFQHLQSSVFRAVENGLAVVRAANTGVSGFISHRGQVLASVKDARGEETFVVGQRTLDLPLLAEKTVYRRGGYLFPYGVAVFFLVMSLWVFGRRSRV